MKMKTAMMICFILSLLLGGNFESISQTQQNKKPNIIFILTDDLGFGDIGVLFQNQREKEGRPFHKTPNLDKFALEGLALTRHYAAAPVCAPSRASLLLGQHQGIAMIRNNQFDKALPNNHTLGTVLKAAGYSTALIGKYGLQGLEGNNPDTWEAYPTKRGFDYFFGYVRHRDGHNHYPAHHVTNRSPKELYDGNEEISKKLIGCYTTDLFTARAKKYIIDHKSEQPDRPFFLLLGYDTPHAGLEIPTMAYPDGGGLKGGIQYISEEDNFINTSQGEINTFIHPDYRKEEWPNVQQRFATMVRRIDDAIGDLVHLLKDLNLENETIIVFTSDNGPHIESYGYGEYAPDFFESYGNLDGIKRDVWEGGIRVPTLVRWPGKVPKGTTNSSPSGFHDWMATFAELAGVPSPANTNGKSLWPIISGQTNDFSGRVYIEYQVNGFIPKYDSFLDERKGQKRGEMQVIYLDGYKGVRYDIGSHQDEFSIYDTQIDSGERQNLAGTNISFNTLQQEMKKSVLRWRRINATAKRPYDIEFVPAIFPLDKKLEEGLIENTYFIESAWAPYINTLEHKSDKVSISPNLNLNKRKLKDQVFVYEGFIKIDQTGKYNLTCQSESNIVMHIHEALVIDNDFEPFPDSPENTILLEKGYHPIKLVLHSDDGNHSLTKIFMNGVDLNNKDSLFFH
ncbi:sulfatase-like hydrolase/transferase [Aquiflexum sp.]|uniref:sulfatase-like hydrolase/transferase n=1 Tax=Aquiflexum sp. TaxID=1872584 RepID=UPI0035940474